MYSIQLGLNKPCHPIPAFLFLSPHLFFPGAITALFDYWCQTLRTLIFFAGLVPSVLHKSMIYATSIHVPTF